VWGPRKGPTLNRSLPASLALLTFVFPAIALAQTSEPVPPPLPPAPDPAVATSLPPAAPPPPAPPATPSLVELTSLRLMRDKGILSQAEYDSAIRDLSETSGARAPDGGTVVMGKWATTLYGFAEADNIYDTTRSFNDLAGGTQVARAETQAGQNPRFQMGVRNSRIGFRLKAPEVAGAIRTSAMLEMDFLGTQLPVGNSGQAYQGTEGAFFTNPTLRVRHANLKVETPIVDVLAGQYWQLFGWQSAYQPNTVEIQGVPGEIYSRTPQVRISKTIKAHPVTIELAVAAMRPVERDSGAPDGEAGLRLAIDSWTGVQTVGATGSQIAPFSVAVTGLLRHVAVDNYSQTPTYTNSLSMGAIAVDGFVPIIPGSLEHKGNTLSLTGEFATGSGFADMYTSTTGGAGFPAFAAPAGSPAGTASTPFAADIDNGIVTYDANGALHSIDWQSYMVGAQYYLPGLGGKMWLSGNYSHMFSDNMHLYGTATKLTSVYDWFDVNVFVDPTPSIRVGAEYANFNTQYVDGAHAINHRVQLSGFFIF
jgi:hypothetical protein